MQALNIREFLNSNKLSMQQWILIILCFFIVAIDGMDVAIMGFVAPSILAEWNIGKPVFGVVMGAAPIGLAIGALLAGSSSDYFGRRKVLLASVLFFGVATVLTAYANNVTEMAIYRFLTGLGLGAAMPNTTTLLSEYIPEQRKGLILTAMFTGFNLGSGVIGFIASALIPSYGWRAVLLFGGIAPLVLLVFMLFLLPESAKFMVIRQYGVEKIRKVFSRMFNRSFDSYDTFITGDAPTASKQPIGVLFEPEYRLKTISLWLTYFMGLMVIYLSTSWLPTMMKDAGLTISDAANATAMFQIGGVFGALLVGFMLDKGKPSKIIATAYAIGAISLLLLAFNGLMSPYVVALICFVGFCLSGAQTGLNAYAPNLYPSVARATGVSAMLGVGRLGSILGSSIGGVLLAQDLGFGGIFALLAIPAILAACFILLSGKH